MHTLAGTLAGALATVSATGGDTCYSADRLFLLCLEFPVPTWTYGHPRTRDLSDGET